MISWTKEDLRTLTRLFPRHSTEHVAADLGRSIESVKAMARRLGLKKSPRYLAQRSRQ